jgi:hypothetical protein
MNVLGHWDALERALSEAERALRTSPREAAQGHARVQWAQTELVRVRQQHRGAVEALYSAHDFVSRVLKWEGDDDMEQSELLAEIAKHFPVGGQ